MQEIRGKLKEVAALGASGRFAEMRSLSDEVIRGTNDIALLLDIGTFLSSYGFLTDARLCYQKAQTLAPTDLRAQVNNKKDTHFNCLNKQHSLNSCPWPAPVAPPSRWPTHLSETYADNFESGWISVLFL